MLDFNHYQYATHASTGNTIDGGIYGTLGFDMSDCADDIDAWKERTGFAYNVIKTPVQFTVPSKDGNTTLRTCPDRWVLHRDDDATPLGIVGGRFKYPQPSELIEFFRSLVDSLGYKLRTAVTLQHGRKVMVIAETGYESTLGLYDRMGAYLMLSSQYDVGMSSLAQFTHLRMACVNIAEMMMKGNESTVRVPHFQHFSADAIKARLSLTQDDWDNQMMQLERYAEHPLHKSERLAFFHNVLRISVPLAEIEEDQEKHKNEARHIGRLEQAYRSAPGQSMATCKNTLWGALNAVTYWADHTRKTRGDHTNRINSSLFGASATTKRRAFELANDIVEAA